MIENDIPLFVDPELFAYQSRDFRENYEKAVAAGRNEVRYDEINEYTMTTLLESVCPAVYNTYPRPPSVLEVANLSLCAYRLKMDNFLKVCERILKEDWAPWKTWPAQLLANFNAAYRCRMCIDLQARLLSAVICNPLYGYNTENEMFFSPTANVFLRALVQLVDVGNVQNVVWVAAADNVIGIHVHDLVVYSSVASAQHYYVRTVVDYRVSLKLPHF
ncbi:unnamed protein product [Toxocara canis]|uniref:ORF143 n=1 Tax=Toxocara canis TaxID=6265 RepID=A0A183UME7_TOXCA|nr:unnamed protein product [Toxocara canis]